MLKQIHRKVGTWWLKKRKWIAPLFWINVLIWFWPVYFGLPVYQMLTTPDIVTAQVEITKEEPITYAKMPEEVKEALLFYADAYGVSKDLVFKIVGCESNFNPDRTGDFQVALTSHGLWQFQPLTFYSYAKKYGVKNADINDWRHQTIVAMQMLRDGEAHQWTCAR